MTTTVDIHSKEWTPEEQRIELARRLKVLRFGEAGSVLPPFTHRPNDVLCIVPHKNGTTWLTHICHQIRMQGSDPDFDDQTKVVCWIEWNKILHGIEPDAVKQPAEPYVYATHHTDYNIIPEAERMIYCFRDQLDALYSLYLMFDSLLILRGRVELGIFAETFINGMIRKRLEDLVGWWKRRNQENILLIFYEDLKQNHAQYVARIAKFIRVSCSDEVIARVVHTTTHAEMSKQSFRFATRSSAHELAQLIGEETDLDAKEYVTRVRRDGGRSGDGKLLPQHVRDSYYQMWKEIITPELGFHSLEEMREAWKQERESKHQL